MIITCPNCNKKFNIDNSLIPDEGRDLQCGSCNHVWLYKIKEENSKILELKEEIDINDIKTKVDKNNEEIVENKNPLTKIETELNNIISSPGNTSINGFFRVSSKIINATKDIINTIK